MSPCHKITCQKAGICLRALRKPGSLISLLGWGILIGLERVSAPIKSKSYQTTIRKLKMFLHSQLFFIHFPWLCKSNLCVFKTAECHNMFGMWYIWPYLGLTNFRISINFIYFEILLETLKAKGKFFFLKSMCFNINSKVMSGASTC